MRKLLALLTIFISVSFLSFEAFAISEQEQLNSIADQNRLIQRQQQFEQEQFRQKELLEIAKEQKKLEEEEQKEKPKEALETTDDRCFQIEEIVLSENKIISKYREKKLTKNYLNQCLTIAKISELSRKISDYLIDQGYVTSRVEVPPQNLNNGILQLKIIESYLEEINLNQDGFFDKAQKFMAFGFSKEDEIFNLRKVEQGLEQINRLSSNNANVKVNPGSEKGYSILAIENHPKNRFRPNISYNNYGSKTTGKRRDSIGFSMDNSLWLNDSFSLSRTANDLDGNKANKGSRAISSSFSVPFSWYNLTLSYSKSSYYFYSGSTTRFKSSGSTSTKTVSLDRILMKKKRSKLALNLDFTNKYNQSFIDSTKVETSSKKASIAEIGLSSTFFLENATLLLNPSYAKSLKILDAKKDDSDIASNSAHAQFEMLKFYGNYAKKSQIFQTPFSYSLTFDSQISKQRLYSVDQFYVGGIYSVRGFSEGSISGDSGYNIKNELNVNLWQAIAPYFTSTKIYDKLSYLKYFYLTPFFDYGYIRAKGGQESGRLSGAGTKITFSGKNISANLVLSWVTSKSHLLDDDYSENRAIYFDLSYQLGFL